MTLGLVSILVMVLEEPLETDEHLFGFEHLVEVTHNYVSSCPSRNTILQDFGQHFDHLGIITFIERSQKRLSILVSFQDRRIFVQLRLFQNISNDKFYVKNSDNCFVSSFIIIEKNSEFVRGLLIVLIWLVSVQTLVIGKTSGLLIGVLGPFIWDHVEYHTN